MLKAKNMTIHSEKNKRLTFEEECIVFICTNYCNTGLYIRKLFIEYDHVLELDEMKHITGCNVFIQMSCDFAGYFTD